MQVTIEIRDDLAQRVREAVGEDLARAAIEGYALEGYRAGALTRFEVQQLLGFDNRWDTERWLGRRGARMNYSLADLESDRATLDRMSPAPTDLPPTSAPALRTQGGTDAPMARVVGVGTGTATPRFEADD